MALSQSSAESFVDSALAILTLLLTTASTNHVKAGAFNVQGGDRWTIDADNTDRTFGLPAFFAAASMVREGTVPQHLRVQASCKCGPQDCLVTAGACSREAI